MYISRDRETHKNTNRKQNLQRYVLVLVICYDIWKLQKLTLSSDHSVTLTELVSASDQFIIGSINTWLDIFRDLCDVQRRQKRRCYRGRPLCAPIGHRHRTRRQTRPKKAKQVGHAGRFVRMDPLWFASCSFGFCKCWDLQSQSVKHLLSYNWDL